MSELSTMRCDRALGLWIAGVAKMASYAIFQYNVLAIDDTHNIGLIYDC